MHAIVGFCLGVLLAMSGQAVFAQASGKQQIVTLELESWRVEDQTAWNERILPRFNSQNSGMQVQMRATQPVEYDERLLSKLRQGAAGDLITCRPFDASHNLYDLGYLEDITSNPVLRRFRSHSKIAWTTYYADRVFCVPVASVMTGFFYNKRIFNELQIKEPTTEEELIEALKKVANSGKYEPLAFGTKDSWQATQVLLMGIGPNYWKGEQGRINLLMGRAKFTDESYVDAWRAVKRLSEFLPKNHQAVGEIEARNMFLKGEAAIYPAGSWEIRFLSQHKNKNDFGVFAPPPPEAVNNCYVLNHHDKGIGINVQSTRKDEAKNFIDWLSTPEFSSIMANTLLGFIPLSNQPIVVDNLLVNEMLKWRQNCESSIRINSQYLNQAWPELEQELWKATVRVMRNEITPEEAAKHISEGVQKWFKPI